MKKKKKKLSRIPFIHPGKKIQRKTGKKIKKSKNLCPALLLAETGLDRPEKKEKNFSPEFRSHSTRDRKFQKKKAKTFKKYKKLIPALFLSKTA